MPKHASPSHAQLAKAGAAKKATKARKALPTTNPKRKSAPATGGVNFLESIFIDRATLNGTRPNSP
jgi:hypothetical protein